MVEPKPRQESLCKAGGNVICGYVLDVSLGQRRLTLEFNHEPNQGEITSALAHWINQLKDEGWLPKG